MENEKCMQPRELKTLINSVERLELTLGRFEELERLSEILVAKFKRTENVPAKTELMGDKPNNSQPDIIDLFNNVNEKLNVLLGQIGSNVEKVINMID